MAVSIEDSNRLKELTELLKKASDAYYNRDEEIMSNFEYDALYDELVALEEKTGTRLSGSPTVNVGYTALSELVKVTHEYPMLSLGKTKDREELKSWLKGKEGVMSWKEDGLTTVLTYENGELIQAVTRGNGVIGEDITHNAKTYVNIPQSIDYKGHLVVRGESVITYTDFEKINATMGADAKYKNPRNLCSGTVRQLNSEICAKRNVRFIAFTLVDTGDFGELDTIIKRFEFLDKLGFQVVEYKLVTEATILDEIEARKEAVTSNDIPSDGLVLSYNDVAYGMSLGNTAKFPRHSIAFKWQDETAETTLREIDWSASRTGLINPVAVFDPVELEGTTVTRASLHNLSIIEGLKLGIGDTIKVFKANMIIPQISENLTKSDNLAIPDKCPVCSGKTEIKMDNESKVLMCTNPYCPAKKIKSFSNFVSRDAMNIDGLSEQTLEKFVDRGFISEFADIYKLDRFKEDIVSIEGFGNKAYNNLITAIEKSRECKTGAFLYSIGIPGVGRANAKLICEHYDFNIDSVMNADEESLTSIDGVGDVMAQAIVGYFANPTNINVVNRLLEEVHFVNEKRLDDNLIFSGKSFVITGSLNSYENRNQLKEEIESLGGKVMSAVSAKTTYLINNDITSNSSKNKKAKELNIPIITEEDYINLKNEN